MEKRCPFCNSIAKADPNAADDTILWDCPACGRFKLSANSVDTFLINPNVKDMVATYLFYNGIHKKGDGLLKSNRQYIWLDDELYESDNSPFSNVTFDQIKAFYNVIFTEKISMILLDVARKTRYFSEYIEYTFEELLSLTFCKRWNDKKIYDSSFLVKQVLFILKYLKENAWIEYDFHNEQTVCKIQISSSGWARVEQVEQDDGQKKNVFIAMAFKESMNETRDTLKKVIVDNGFNPRIMDEIEHNRQIVPEMLYEIRQAKFIIAELTGHNNGAYFEAGYALGLGKEVIQVCRKDAFDDDGHFDVKQVNTVLWEDQDDLYKRLDARIKATIS